ncbi:MAG: ABC transporter ATP-binding protein [Dethiosulfovibrio peptidovorans]|nr:MAG: ABC transporter ATP-binding protein [Dethiosulfovibrio peptidovorans]
MDNLVEMRGLVKSFGSVEALRGVDFELRRGEVVALLGDNGAGKSTLIKILSGVYRPDSGTMSVAGHAVDFRRYGVAQARALGVETVYQERSLGERQPLWRNVFIGRHRTNRWGFIDVRREKKETMALLSSVLGFRGAGLSANASVSTLSGGERQGLAIARAMHFGAEIIVLDEPTTALALSEVEKVLSFIRSIGADGRGCVVISHDLGHVYRVADRFAIMDRGRIEGVYEKADISAEELMARMVHLLEAPSC